MRRLFVVGAVVAGMLFVAPAAGANVITVNTENDSYNGSSDTCSLREAITAANTNAPFDGCPAGIDDDYDTIKLPAGEYRITRIGDPDDNTNEVGDFDVLGFDSRLAIEPINKTAKVVLSGNGFDRILDQRDNSLLSVNRIHLSDGLSETGPGGAVRVNAGSFSLNASTVSDSYSGVAGGGIYAGPNGGLNLRNSTIALNRTDGDGGGLALVGGSGGVFYNTTIVGNEADADENNDGDGGGLYSETVLEVDGVGLTIFNTLLAKNRDLSSPGVVADQCVSTTAFLPRYSFSTQQFGQSPCLIGNGGSTNLHGANPKIGPILADNGGQTPTVAPLAGSPLIDAAGTSGAAKCDPVDQTGRRRSEGSCDIGSVEYVVPPRLVFKKIRPKKKSVRRGGKLKVKVLVRNAGDDPAKAVRVCLTVKAKKAKRALKVSGASCRNIGTLAGGKTAKPKSFVLKADRRARAKAYRVVAKATGKGVSKRSKAFKVKVK